MILCNLLINKVDLYLMEKPLQFFFFFPHLKQLKDIYLINKNAIK